MMTRGSPNSTGCWFSIRICAILPARGAVTGLNVFIASISRQGRAGGDRVANLDEFRRAFFSLQVDRADHRGLNRASVIAQVRLGRRRARHRRQGCTCRSCRSRRIGLRNVHGFRLGLHDLDAHAALFDLDLAEVRFPEDRRELADESGIEPAGLLGRLVGHVRQTLFCSVRAATASMASR